jgi:hypothetical protein
VKALELEAERRLMFGLEGLATTSGTESLTEAALLSRTAEAYREPLPEQAFGPLLRLLNSTAA